LGRTEPARRPRRDVLPYLVLLRVGFSLPPPLLTARCALTAPFHPYPAQLRPEILWVPQVRPSFGLTWVLSPRPLEAVGQGGIFSVALSVNDP